MALKNFFVGLCVFSYSATLFCMDIDERKGSLSFTEMVTLLDEFSYLDEKPIDSLVGNVSGLLSTSDPSKLRELICEIDRQDRLFFDYDEVLFTSDWDGSGFTNFRITHSDMCEIFHTAKEKTHVYILSVGNNYAYEGSQFGMYGTAIPEPLKSETIGSYINPLPNGNDLAGLNPFIVPIARGGAVRACIDFCKCPKESSDEPFLSIYPTLGAFHVGRAYWCPDYSWHKIKNEEIERVLSASGCSDDELYIIRYLYAKVPLKAKIMKTILIYLSGTGDSAVPRDILFVDDSLLNCKAFLYYVRELKRFGFFTGNVKVVHLTIPHNRDNFIENLAIEEVEKAFSRYR